MLSNADFPPLPTVSRLHSTWTNAFSDKHIYNTTAVTLFRRVFFFQYLKTFFLRIDLFANWIMKSEFPQIKRRTVNHVLRKSLMSRDIVNIRFSYKFKIFTISNIRRLNSKSFYRILLLLSGDISLNPGPKNNLQPLDSNERNVFKIKRIPPNSSKYQQPSSEN